MMSASVSSDDSSISVSLDCVNGLNCSDYECQFRHLDVIEQKGRSGEEHDEPSFERPTEPRLIITASCDMGRSASTWVFNAVRLLYRKAKVICDSYWMRELSKEKLQQRMQDTDGAHVLVKTHEWTDTNVTKDMFENELLPLFTNIIVSVREGFAEDPEWMKVATHVIHYEDIVEENKDNDMNVGALSVLRALADHLESELSDSAIREVDYELMTLPIPSDQSAKFWSFHSRRGGRPQPMIPPRSNRYVFVTRHGARIDNGPDRDGNWLQNSRHGRPQDAPLSPHGHQAASELASAFVALKEQEGIVLDHIISSPFLRCIETANAIANAFDLSIKVEPGISEVGSKSSHMAAQAELIQRFPRIDRNYTPIMGRDELPGSEYSDDVAARRSETVARRIVMRLPGSILFVAHGASCSGLIRAFGTEDRYVGYCSLTRFQWDKKNEVWFQEGKIGDVSHLSDQRTPIESAW